MFGVIRFHAYPRIGGFLSPHGLGIAVGYLAGGMLFVRHAARRGISADDVWNMLMRAVFGVIIGARLFYVVGHLGDYFGPGNSPLDIVKVWEGGVVFYGGAIGGIVAAIPYLRSHGISIRAALDSAAPGFPLGLIFGRIGDIIVGDHLGGASSLPFAFRFAPYEVPPDTRPWVAHAFQSEGDLRACFETACHQTALYDLVSVSILLPVLLWIARKPRAKGFLISFTATWYAAARFATDFARDAAYYGAGPIKLHGTQWASLAILLVGVGYLIKISRSGERDEWVTPDTAAGGAAAAVVAATTAIAGPDAAASAALATDVAVDEAAAAIGSGGDEDGEDTEPGAPPEGAT